jgi:hypothetical protein
VGDIDTVVVDSLKALDLEWPIREADVAADTVLRPLRARALNRFAIVARYSSA